MESFSKTSHQDTRLSVTIPTSKFTKITMENNGHRATKRIVMDGDEEEEEDHVPVPVEEAKKTDGLGGLFDDDNEDSDAKVASEAEEEEGGAGLFGEEQDQDEEQEEEQEQDQEEEEEDQDGYDYGQEQEVEIEQREMDLTIPRYPPSHKPSEEVRIYPGKLKDKKTNGLDVFCASTDILDG